MSETCILKNYNICITNSAVAHRARAVRRAVHARARAREGRTGQCVHVQAMEGGVCTCRPRKAVCAREGRAGRCVHEQATQSDVSFVCVGSAGRCPARAGRCVQALPRSCRSHKAVRTSAAQHVQAAQNRNLPGMKNRKQAFK